MVRAFDKLARPRAFKQGDLVMVKCREAMAGKSCGKLLPTWLGPYIVTLAYEGGAYRLVDHKGNVPFPPLNGKHLKLYHAPEHEFPGQPPKQKKPIAQKARSRKKMKNGEMKFAIDRGKGIKLPPAHHIYPKLFSPYQA